MDQLTQQNAALVEEAAAAAHSLQDMSATLARSVSVFEIEGEQGVPPDALHQFQVMPSAE